MGRHAPTPTSSLPQIAGTVARNREELEHGMAVRLGGEVRHRSVLGRAELGVGLAGDSHIALQDGARLVRSDLADR